MSSNETDTAELGLATRFRLSAVEAAHEIEIVIDPDRAHRSQVRPPIGIRCGQPAGAPGPFLAGLLLKLLQCPRPRNRLVSVDVQVLLLHLLLLPVDNSYDGPDALQLIGGRKAPRT